jgi:hypothetical protein
MSDPKGDASRSEANRQLANSREQNRTPGEERRRGADKEQDAAAERETCRDSLQTAHEEKWRQRKDRAEGEQEERRGPGRPGRAPQFVRIDPKLFAVPASRSPRSSVSP